ncbi:MAG: ATP-binding protein [bacterium]
MIQKIKDKGKQHINHTDHLIWVGGGLGILFWALEACLHVFIFKEGSFISQLFAPNLHEIWMRLLVMFFFIIFGIYSHLIVAYRKRIETEVKNSKAKLDQIFNTAADGMRVIDKNFKVIHVNETFSTLARIPMDKMMGRKCYETLYGPMCHTPRCSLIRIIRGEKRIEFDVEKICQDGTKIPCIVTATPFRGANGELIGIVEDFKDITARKHAEEALKQALAKAKESDHLKSAFLANMSHEIRTPMNSIIGYTDLMLNDHIGARHQDDLQVIKRNGHLLLKLIDDILDLSKIEAGQLNIENLPFSLRSLLNDIDINTKMLIQEKGKEIVFHYCCPDTLGEWIMGDSVRIEQILNNLIGNAIKFTEKGFIKCSCSLKKEDLLEFSIQDTGIGIPADKHGIIFDAFKQKDDSITRQYGGTGLGLTITKKLVELMGGNIHVHSDGTHEQGSIFSFTLPYKTAAQAKSPQEVPALTIFDTKPSYTILLAEDNLENQRLAQRILEKAGFNVLIANDGQETVALYASNPSIDLILLDIQMPILDGLAATRTIRSMENGKNRVPIIALTSYAMEGDREKCINAGCNHYLSKPINHTELLKTLKKYLF